MSETDTTPRSEAEAGGDEAIIRWWFSELQSARKREKEWREQGAQLVEIVEGAKKDTVPFNILYSNTETLSPAVYNSTPRPVVKPRYKKNDPMPALAASLAGAYLDYFVDTGDVDEVAFDDIMISSLQEGLVPGRGLCRHRYSADVRTDEKGEAEALEGEYTCMEGVSYDRFLHGFAKKWKEVPWISFEIPMTEEEAKAFLKDDAKYLTAAALLNRDKESSDEGPGKVKDSEGVPLYWFYEVWDKSKKEVFFLVDGVPDRRFKVTADPYKLDGFYPVPEPLTFVTKISSLTPRALYELYENQSKELNEVTLRIKAIIRAIKATGGYNPMIEALDKILEFEDGKLAPIANIAALGDGAKLESAVWVWPAEKFIIVLQQLYEARERIKTVIYEITGISDILRGSSVASETATAQNLKNQWGSLRLKRFQKVMARYVKENLRIAAELAFKKLRPETLKEMTGSPLPLKAEQEKAKQIAAAAVEKARAMALTMPPGSPPPPPEIPPETQAIISTPAFEDVVELLKNDMRRSYAIDIETNSTVDAEATEDKANITEFLTAMGQFFSGIGPLVENGTLPFPAAKMMLLTISRKFRLGRELDEEIASMQQAPQGQGGAEAAKAMEEVKKAQEALQAEQAKLQQEKLQIEFDKKAAKLEADYQMKMVQAEKANAIKEIQAELARAQKTLQTEAELAQERQSLTEEGTQMRLGIEGEKLEGKAKEVEGKAKEVEAADPANVAAEVIKPVVEALMQEISKGFMNLSKQITAPRKAVKGPDGSWTASTDVLPH